LKKYIFLSLSINLIHCEQPINIYNTNNNSVVVDLQNEVKQLQKAHQETVTDFNLAKKKFADHLRNIGRSSINLADDIGGNNSTNQSFFTKKNILYIGAGILGIGYIYTYIKVRNAIKKLEANNTWSNWKNNLTLEQLQESSKEELLEELENDIKRFYKNNLEIISTPKAQFEKDLEEEKNILKSFINLHNNLKKYRVAFLFPIKDEQIKSAQEKLYKLFFISGLYKEHAPKYTLKRSVSIKSPTISLHLR